MFNSKYYFVKVAKHTELVLEEVPGGIKYWTVQKKKKNNQLPFCTISYQIVD